MIVFQGVKNPLEYNTASGRDGFRFDHFLIINPHNLLGFPSEHLYRYRERRCASAQAKVKAG